MRKFLIAGIIAMLSLSLSAQYRWGVVGGYNYSHYHFRQPLIEKTNGSGFSLGVMSELMFPGIGFGVEGAILYNMHSGRINLGEREIWASEGYGNEMCTISSLQIPINVKFKYSNLNGIERYVAPFVYGGPVFCFTIGHNKLNALEYPAGNVQLQVGLGAEIFEKYQVSAGYYWGMTYEIRTIKLENFSARPRGWMVKVAYLF